MIDFLNIFSSLNKSLVMLLLMVIGVWFRLRGYLSGDNFVDLLKTTVVSYFGAHIAEHFTAMVRDHLASKNAPLAIANDPTAIPLAVDDAAPEVPSGK
jgi:purine-cytosine permease-like protein